MTTTYAYQGATPGTVHAGSHAGADERLVLEAPLESLTEATRRTIMLSHLVAQEHLPAPGPARGVKVRFHTPYSRSVQEIYEQIAERPVAPFATGKGWVGHYDPNRNEAWVDVSRHAAELPRHLLHELFHSWREGTAEARTMSAEEKEAEAWDFADEWLGEVFRLASEPQAPEGEEENA